LDRVCAEDTTLGPYNVKKDTLINFPIYAMHHNPKYFPEPEKFKPERFLKNEGEENLATQFAFIPFGGGPRQCIGMRFAMVEVKIAMAKLLANYKIVDTPQTKLEILPGDFFILTFPDVKVKLEKRVF
jgi:cytochrome P450 family 3 subfamily A